MKSSKSVLIIFFIAVSAWSAFSVDVNEMKNTISNYLPEGVTLPDVDGLNAEDLYKKFTEAVKQKCFEVSGSDSTYDDAYNAAIAFSECFQNLADFSNIGEEIEKAKPTGDLDLVFNKYCSKRQDALKCLENFSNATNPCLNEDEKSHKQTFMGMVKRLLEFVCHDNGNQIALFIAEEGPECFSSKQDQLMNCFNQTFSKYIADDFPSTSNIPSFTLTQENCADIKKLENCVVTELEKCRESTPANLVEALFRYVKKETICKRS